jgi:hypothetical protein
VLTTPGLLAGRAVPSRVVFGPHATDLADPARPGGFSGTEETRAVDAVVACGPRAARAPVTSRVPVVRVGDAVAPRRLDAAVREGHDAAVAL